MKHRPASESVHNRLIAKFVTLCAVFALVITVIGSASAPASFAADNPDIKISNLQVVKLKGPGGDPVPGEGLILWNYAKMSFDWDASATKPRNGDSFWVELPDEFKALDGGVLPMIIPPGSQAPAGQYGECRFQGRKFTCTFNERVQQLSDAGFSDLKGSADFEVQAKQKTTATVLNVKISASPGTASLPLPGGQGIVSGPYKPAAALSKRYDVPQASETSIRFHYTFGTEKLREKYQEHGIDKVFDGQQFHTLVFTDTMAPGLSFMEDPGAWSLTRTKEADPAAPENVFLASNGAPNANGEEYSINVEVLEKSASGSKAKVTLTGPFKDRANYILIYKASVDGPNGPVPPTAGVGYNNAVVLEENIDQSETSAVYFNNASVTIQMKEGYGSFMVTKSAQGDGAGLLEADKPFPVTVKWVLPNGENVDTWPQWNPPGVLSPDRKSGTAVMNAKLGTPTAFSAEVGRSAYFPAGTQITLSEDLSTVTPPTGYTWGTPIFDKSTFTVEEGTENITKVSLTNNLVAANGKFSVKKTVTGLPTTVDAGSYSFTYSCQKGEDTPVKGRIDNVPADGTVVTSPESFPLGSQCEITEVAPQPIPGYSLQLPASQTVTISSSTIPAAVEFTNTYARDMATFAVKKSVTGLDNGVVVPKFSFDYSCVVPGQDTITGTITDVVAGDPAQAVGRDFPTGTTCTVTEKAPTDSINGYTLTLPPAQTLVLDTKGKTVEFAFTNTYARDMATFAVKKSVTGLDNGVVVPKFSFDYSCVVPGQDTITGTITDVVAGDPAQAVGRDFPTGTTCTVTEKAPTDSINGYTLTLPPAQTLVLDTKGKTVEFAFTNTYSPIPGKGTPSKIARTGANAHTHLFASLILMGAGALAIRRRRK